jgi:hypothetical protein
MKYLHFEINISWFFRDPVTQDQHHSMATFRRAHAPTGNELALKHLYRLEPH